jgi:hypothetical protein
VKQLLELAVGKVSRASTVEPKKNNLNILDTISQIISIEWGFKKLPFLTFDCNNYWNFQQVCLATSPISLKCKADEGLTLLFPFFPFFPRCFEGV